MEVKIDSILIFESGNPIGIKRPRHAGEFNSTIISSAVYQKEKENLWGDQAFAAGIKNGDKNCKNL